MIGDLTIKFGAETGEFIAPIAQVNTGLENVSNTAVAAKFNLDSMAVGFRAMQSAAGGLSLINNQFGLLQKTATFVVAGLTSISAGISAIGGLAFTVASGLAILAQPLLGLVIVGKAVVATFGAIAAVIIAPFRLAFAVLTAFTNAVLTLLRPVLAVAKAFFMLKVSLSSFKTQIKLLGGFLAVLPPPLRLLVVGLAAVGVAGRAGAFAINLAGKAIRLFGFAVLATTQPLKALGVAILFAGKQLALLSLRAAKAALSLGKMALASVATGIKNLGLAAVQAGNAILNKLVTSASAALKTLLLIGAAATGWGVKLFADAEQAEIAFTTMLKSGSAARKVLGELEQFAASTPFQLTDLQDGAKQLLNAQVPTEELTGKLRMLGDIAAGTGKPINDFVRIYAKVKSTGKVSLETLNQLAERGVPIYSALGSALGVSREQMLKMISSGQVGFEDLNTALQATATGTGVFAGGMAAQSQTIAGLWSTLKDNVSFAMRELGSQISAAFDFKGLMNDGITFFQTLRETLAKATPAFIVIAETARAAFMSIWEIISVVFNAIGGAIGVNQGNFMSSFMDILAVAKFVFKNWPDLAELAFTKMALFAVRGFAVITNFFTSTLPTLLVWFGGAFADVFLAGASLVATVFRNMGENIRRIMASIWSFIASGGTRSLSLAWQPLTEGFVATVREIPDIPKRAIGDLEKSLQQDADRIGGNMGASLAEEFLHNQELLNNLGSQAQVVDNQIAATLPDKMELEDPTTASAPSASASGTNASVAGLISKGSKEAFDAISRHRSLGNQDALVAQKQTAKNTGELLASSKATATAISQMNERMQAQPSMNFVVGGLS